MHLKIPVAVALALATLALSSPAPADPLAINALPEDTRWVIHCNVDAARSTPLWELVRARMLEPNRARATATLARVEAFTGVRILQDLHDVTLYGASFDESAVCISIHAPFDQKRLTDFLKTQPEFSQQDYHGHSLLTWRDKDRNRLLYGCFAPGDVAIAAPDLNVLKLALDTMDGKTPGLMPNSPLNPAAAKLPGGAGRSTPVVWVASTSIFELPHRQAAESPFLLQMEAASFAVTLAPDKVAARLVVEARTDKAAQQLNAFAEGVKATINLTAAAESARPPVKMLSAALQNLELSVDGRMISADWWIAMDKIEAAADLLRPRLTPNPASPAAIRELPEAAGTRP